MAYADGMERDTSEWLEGFAAFEEGQPIQANPYDFGELRDRWEQGWQEALTTRNATEAT